MGKHSGQAIGKRRRKLMKKMRNIIAQRIYWIKEGEHRYHPRSDKYLRRLAMDIEEGKIFTSDHIREYDAQLLPSIFMPLFFSGRDFHFWMLKKNKIMLIYEYLSKAGPRSINGYPIFFSMQMLNLEDYKKLNRFRAKILAFKEEYGFDGDD